MSRKERIQQGRAFAGTNGTFIFDSIDTYDRDNEWANSLNSLSV